MTDTDRTAQTEPLTTGQQIVAKWEGLDSGWTEPADLAEGIDNAITAARKAALEEAAKVADLYIEKAWPAGDIAADIRELKR